MSNKRAEVSSSGPPPVSIPPGENVEDGSTMATNKKNVLQSMTMWGALGLTGTVVPEAVNALSAAETWQDCIGPIVVLVALVLAYIGRWRQGDLTLGPPKTLTPALAPVTLALLLAGCAGTRQAAADANNTVKDTATTYRLIAGDASTDPVNIDPNILIAQPGGSNSNEPIDIQARAHNPVAGWNLVATLLSAGAKPGNDNPVTELLAEDVRIFRAVWLQDTTNAEAKANYEAAKKEFIDHVSSLPEPVPLDLSGVALPTHYTYSPIVMIYAGTLDDTPSKAVENLSGIVREQRAEFVDEAVDETE